MSSRNHNRKTSKKTKTVRNPHLSYAQIRGLVQLFKSYFVVQDANGRTKRLSRQEINRRWSSYRRSVFEDYKRVVRGTLNSEKTFVKRHTNPLAFLKYKNGRAKNLSVDELSAASRQYFLEIGGTLNLSELFATQPNVDNVDDLAFTQEPPTKRRRFNSPSESVMSQMTSSQDPMLPSMSSSQANVFVIDSTVPPSLPPLLINPQPKLENQDLFSETLKDAYEKFTAFEKEQLIKKQAEVQTLVVEKCNVVTKHVRRCLEMHPELLGFIPFSAVDEQITNGFDYWLNQHVMKIKSRIPDVATFLVQIGLLKSDEAAWRNFVHGWKMHRIMYQEDFGAIWNWIIQELNLEVRSDKEEADDDESVELTEST